MYKEGGYVEGLLSGCANEKAAKVKVTNAKTCLYRYQSETRGANTYQDCDSVGSKQSMSVRSYATWG